MHGDYLVYNPRSYNGLLQAAVDRLMQVRLLLEGFSILQSNIASRNSRKEDLTLIVLVRPSNFIFNNSTIVFKNGIGSFARGISTIVL